MPDRKQIPHLINLLDDDSPHIREAVFRELDAFGPALNEELKRATLLRLNPDQEKNLFEILGKHKRAWLRDVWPHWLTLLVDTDSYVADYQRLESALSIISKFLAPPSEGRLLKDLLDELALEYERGFPVKDPMSLAEFLFRVKGLRGDEEDYYNLQNSNLAYVITQKKGIPISLTAVYMLVGLRVGIKVEGCHFPGHFLARIHVRGQDVFVDCFNGGHMIEPKKLLSLRQGMEEGVGGILDQRADVSMMVFRFLANLIHACQMSANEDDRQLFMELFRAMEADAERKKIARLKPEDIIDDPGARFVPAQRVRHIHYGYQGIVVAVDRECQATDDWYYANQTQPSRHQAWYHVLVHGSDKVTYVAESNLQEDPSREKISHSLLAYFFDGGEDGKYVRNSNPWPETDF